MFTEANPCKSQGSLFLARSFFGTVILVVLILASCKFQNPEYIYIEDHPVIGSDGNPIKLKENPNAINPSYEELTVFIKADHTEDSNYVDGDCGGYRCTEFARDLHNNLESFGAKTAFVAVSFVGEDVGHAIDAVQTTDRGLVYIDCTGAKKGEELSLNVVTRDPNRLIAGKHDTIAYVVKGKPYGTINLDYAVSNSYDFYSSYCEQCSAYEQTLEKYDADVARFNLDADAYKQESDNAPKNISQAEWERLNSLFQSLQARREDLDKRLAELQITEAQLGDYWFDPLGVVENIYLHW
jgi:hypothetical protein